MKLTSTATILDFDPFEVNTGDSAHNLGEQVVLADGRNFRYGKASTTSTVGKLQLAPAPIPNHVNMVTAAASLGATQVTVTPAATGGAANIYSEGYLVVNASAGLGRSYQVKGHPTISASVAFTVDLFDPIRGVALTSSSRTTLVHNPYNGFLQGTTATVRGAGVPSTNLAADDYAFIQTRGVADRKSVV